MRMRDQARYGGATRSRFGRDISPRYAELASITQTENSAIAHFKQCISFIKEIHGSSRN